MAICRRCGNQMADTAAACPACGELRYQQPAAPAAAPQYAAPQYPAQQPAQPQYQQPHQPQAQYPQQAYAAPQQAAPAQPQYAMPMVSADEAKGFIGALFDFSFTSFITTKLIKFIYILAVVCAALGVLGVIGTSFYQSATSGLLMLVISPVIFVLYAVLIRMYLELVIVIFRGAEHLAEIAKNTKR